MAETMIDVEVVYAAVDRQVLLTVAVAPGCTVSEAVRLSGIADQFVGEDVLALPVGIYGKVVSDPHVRAVEEGDRIELYRPLLADPMEVRRLRAAKAAKNRQ
ncbi:RnfH family protein [Pseudomonas abieticivorans]|uniref:RnfH family protein n=1 Tax=Pseudomonas abieticivorans TaxID=2931382 RepID=UPI0020BD6D25|nr:RnfH family protein [Pseudomonas sp. PIA16]